MFGDQKVFQFLLKLLGKEKDTLDMVSVLTETLRMFQAGLRGLILAMKAVVKAALLSLNTPGTDPPLTRR